ncbi:alginate O-acetyltransferase AlgX-related protein [Amycolatopsis alkalitolerans]|uniref:AlgX/AlgJ SGNH hydrolase-like domain-containing protein n=1 Tax=Amycolatopsis alkalitolerans TaxID=2547244 RepID=A0A5C4M7H0_9PSEU|nr:hypothetical protein [Amycolatopsis alkalitolerans]TNC28001.1 hypothetical protein FG385_06080 [Amycolatopsis alkalitolerans]
MAQEPQQLPAVHEAWLPREHPLHRPRHGGKQLTALISAMVFFVMPTLLWVFGVRPGEIENHRLAGFPSVSAGWGFFTALPTWGTDQLSFRTAAIEAADGISRGVFGEPLPHDQGGTSNSGPLPGGLPPANGDTPTPGADLGPVDQAGYRQVIEGKDGWLYYGVDAEAKCAPNRPLADTIKLIRQIRDLVVASGRQFVWVVPPDKSTMVPQFLPASYPGKECQQAAEGPTWSQLDAAGVLDLRPELRAVATQLNRPVYTPDDTHWTDEGSLSLTRNVAEAVQPGVTKTWRSPAIGSYTGSADLPKLIGKSGTKTSVLYNLLPDGATNRAGPIITDIETPSVHDSAPITGTVNTKTLVYGDSFSIASSRYLTGAFSNLTLLAYSTTKTDTQQAVDQFVAARTVVLETVERAVSAGALPFFDDGFIDQLRTALEQHPVR